MLGDRGSIKKDYVMMFNPNTGRIVGCQFGDEELMRCINCIFAKGETVCGNIKPLQESSRKE
jgi:hypothetical protein